MISKREPLHPSSPPTPPPHSPQSRVLGPLFFQQYHHRGLALRHTRLDPRVRQARADGGIRGDGAVRDEGGGAGGFVVEELCVWATLAVGDVASVGAGEDNEKGGVVDENVTALRLIMIKDNIAVPFRASRFYGIGDH